jgi:hypothetical protein
MHCIRLDALELMRAGDMIPWCRRPLYLTSDPEPDDRGRHVATGEWDGAQVRVVQAPDSELEVWCLVPRQRSGWRPGVTDATLRTQAPRTSARTRRTPCRVDTTEDVEVPHDAQHEDELARNAAPPRTPCSAPRDHGGRPDVRR